MQQKHSKQQVVGSLSFDLLPDGSPVLSVSECCIQSSAKRAYRQVAAALLEGRATSAAIASLAEILEEFLDATDFSALRFEYPELAGGTECRVVLRRAGGGGIAWEILEAL